MLPVRRRPGHFASSERSIQRELGNRQSSAVSEPAATEPSPYRDQRPSASTSFVTSVSITSGPAFDEKTGIVCMNRPYTAHSPYSLTPTERIRSDGDDGGETVDLDRHYDDEYEGVDEYDDIEEYYEPIDRRWVWVAGVAGAILLLA